MSETVSLILALAAAIVAVGGVVAFVVWLSILAKGFSR